MAAIHIFYGHNLTPTTIKARRKTLGLTQTDVANKLGISRVSYLNIENGSRKKLLEYEQDRIRKVLGL